MRQIATDWNFIQGDRKEQWQERGLLIYKEVRMSDMAFRRDTPASVLCYAGLSAFVYFAFCPEARHQDVVVQARKDCKI